MNPGSALLAAFAQLVRREELRGLRLSETAAWSSALCLHSYRGWHGKEGDKIWSGILPRPADSRVRDVRLDPSVGCGNRGLREGLDDKKGKCHRGNEEMLN